MVLRSAVSPRCIYLVLIITLGVTTLRKGHWVMFILGIFLPFFWIIGAIMPPTARAAADAMSESDKRLRRRASVA